jgi:hypothetical protein
MYEMFFVGQLAFMRNLKDISNILKAGRSIYVYIYIMTYSCKYRNIANNSRTNLPMRLENKNVSLSADCLQCLYERTKKKVK